MRLFPAHVDHNAEHAELVRRAVRWLRGHHRCKAVFAELVTYERVIPDAIGFRGPGRPVSILVECKITVADFRADREKTIHRFPDQCPGQQRWYLTPPGLLADVAIPDGWGWAECLARAVRIAHAAPPPAFSGERALRDVGVLYSAVRRHQHGVPWDARTARFESYEAGKEREARAGGEPEGGIATPEVP